MCLLTVALLELGLLLDGRKPHLYSSDIFSLELFSNTRFIQYQISYREGEIVVAFYFTYKYCVQVIYRKYCTGGPVALWKH